jgi:hypothetical protein
VHIDNEPNWDDEEHAVNNLTCLGLVGIEDPVRPEVSGIYVISLSVIFQLCFVFSGHRMILFVFSANLFHFIPDCTILS